MSRLVLRTPSRLHFGLLSWGAGAPREFGGVGLMIEAPGLTISAEPSSTWSAEGPFANRTLATAEQVASRLVARGIQVSPSRLRVETAPPEHVGLGLGTQLGLGVARLIAEGAGQPSPSLLDLASLSGRGLRSGIGLHGFASGGLIVDGGRAGPSGIPPLLARLSFPDGWWVLVLIPGSQPGLHGDPEIRAFAGLPPSPEALTDRLCRLVLLGLLPAVVEQDLPRFGAALDEIQERVGQGFAPAQGGRFAREDLGDLAAAMRSMGLRGVGQSSWGPTLYGFSDAPPDDRTRLLEEIRRRFPDRSLSAFWTRASSRGASLVP